MNYVISDIHGCYNEYLKALELVNFSDNDTLYVLGDCIDRGENSLAVIKDLMTRKNVVMIAGNHEFLALNSLKNFYKHYEDRVISDELEMNFMDWFVNGGKKTFAEICNLPYEEAMKIISFLSKCSLYKKVEINNKKYLMIHGGLEPFEKGKPIKEYSAMQLIWSRCDYDVKHFDDMYTITGHTPTIYQDGNDGEIIRKNNHIAIDCGCAFGGRLAVFCLDNEKVFYVDSEKERK